MNTRSLSFRLVTWYAGVLTIVFIFLGVLTLLFLRHYLEANLLDIQSRRARQIADTLVVNAGRGDEAALGTQVEDLYSPEANDRFIRITRADGTGVYVSGAPRDLRFDPSKVPALPATVAMDTRKVTLPSGSLLVAAQAARARD